jgi:predicted dehydrogenase
MSEVRLGIVGVGAMGSAHARLLLDGKVPRCALAGLCDRNSQRLSSFVGVRSFSGVDHLIDSGEIDALLIATSHYTHTTIGIQALQAGLHVLVEKPISVHKRDAERLVAAHTDPNQVFAAMFNQRTDPAFLKLRELMSNGELGAIRRVNWTVTNWFRTEAYYRSGGWRATWAGEGGGVLLNQFAHNLDLYQWLFGMPSTVRAFCQFGRYHDIEVEDDVTAYLQYPDGLTAVLITSTGEAPGTNRLEVAAERGRIVIEADRFNFTQNEVGMGEFARTSKELFAAPSVRNVDISVSDHGPQHAGILENFIAAILDGVALIAPAEQGIHSVELANAFLLSAWENRSIDLPLDGELYEEQLRKRFGA